MKMMGSPEKFFFCGGLGAGLAAKIANNYLSGTILLATAEAMAIGIKSVSTSISFTRSSTTRQANHSCVTM